MIVFGITDPIQEVLLEVLEWLHLTLGLTWAWSIVALTVIVRMLIVPLTVRQIHSMQNLQRYAPEMKEIQRKYKGDRQKLNEELMKFYKEHQINPAASCLPIIPQIPIFFALFFLLRDFAKDPPPGSLAWLEIVPDISEDAISHWSGYLLLTIYVGSQFFSSYFMTATMEPMQRKIMLILPFFFVFFIINFPIGLVLYWTTTNLWTVGQGLITRRLIPKQSPAPPKKKPRAQEAVAEKRPPEEPKEQQPSGPVAPRKVKRKKKRARR